jgi:thiamine-phosphate pyrophosphorylase
MPSGDGNDSRSLFSFHYSCFMSFSISRVYPILDSSFVPVSGRAAFLDRLGRSLTDADVRLLEYRNKTATDAEVLADARVLRAAMPAGQVKLILDDRVDVALVAGFDGVHVDAGDLPPADARRLLGAERVVGTSASSEAQLLEATGLAGDLAGNLAVDYIAFGPVFATTTKQTSAALLGIDGVRRFRGIAGPGTVLVAAAGITLETAASILAAGADSVAVAAAIFRCESPAAEFRRWMAVLS